MLNTSKNEATFLPLIAYIVAGVFYGIIIFFVAVLVVLLGGIDFLLFDGRLVNYMEDNPILYGWYSATAVGGVMMPMCWYLDRKEKRKEMMLLKIQMTKEHYQEVQEMK